jgi:hypothetical protein
MILSFARLSTCSITVPAKPLSKLAALPCFGLSCV